VIDPQRRSDLQDEGKGQRATVDAICDGGHGRVHTDLG
jgi:hypothetical protein